MTDFPPAAPPQDDDLAALAPPVPGELTLSDGTVLRVLPIKGRQIAPVAQRLRGLGAGIDAVAGLLKPAADGAELDAWLAALEHHADPLIHLLAVATERPVEWVGALDAADLLSLALTVFTVNVDFFTRRMLPLLPSHLVMAWAGRTPSSDSSSTAMADGATTP